MSDHMPVICDLQTNLGTYQDEYRGLNIEIDVYPNPARELVTVKFDNYSGQTIVSLINNFGVVLKKMEVYIDVNSYKVDFDLAGLQSGVYYLRVICENSQEISKIIVY
jgi:hypothetical protein